MEITELFQSGADTVDAHIEEHHDTVAAVTATGPAVPGTAQFCVVYRAAKPILSFVEGLLFFKPKWKAVITALVTGLDAICSVPAE